MILKNEEGNILSVGQYNIIKTLAHSGFSKVYLVKDIRDNNKLYALKAIENPNNQSKIDNELEIFKRISNIEKVIQLRKVFQLSKFWFFLFDYAQGFDLSYKVYKNGKLKDKEILSIMKTLTKTLQEVHNQNIIHNDIKPENILIKDNDYYLCDWGISINKKETDTLYVSTDKSYIAPEIFSGKFDTRSDIYSLGATLYFLSTGEKIYKIEKDSSYSYIMYSHCILTCDISLIKSKKIRYLLSRMLEKNPNKRITLKEIEEVLNSKNDTFENIIWSKTDYNLYKTKSRYELYEELSNKHIPYAIYSLAYLYEYDKKDMNEALELYEKAANLGLIASMSNLAMCYFNNLKIPKDDLKAYYWFKQASNKGFPKAQYYLAYFYERGIITKKDMEIAIKLYKSSAYKGYEKAFDKIRRLKKNNII